MSDHLSEENQLSFKTGTPVWVCKENWAGRLRYAAVLLKVNAKRSKVRYLRGGIEALAPNYAITKRDPLEVEPS